MPDQFRSFRSARLLSCRLVGTNPTPSLPTHCQAAISATQRLNFSTSGGGSFADGQSPAEATDYGKAIGCRLQACKAVNDEPYNSPALSFLKPQASGLQPRASLQRPAQFFQVPGTRKKSWPNAIPLTNAVRPSGGSSRAIARSWPAGARWSLPGAAAPAGAAGPITCSWCATSTARIARATWEPTARWPTKCGPNWPGARPTAA